MKPNKHKYFYDEISCLYKEYDESLKLLGLSELCSEFTRQVKRQRVITFMDSLDELVVLDIGCGQGRLLSEISGKIKLGIGLDISRNIFLKTSQNVELAEGDACFLPFADGCFDRVVAMELIEHLSPEQANRMLEEINRVLKKDGKLIITTPLPKNFITYSLASVFSVIDFFYYLCNPLISRYWKNRLRAHKAASKKYSIKEHIKEYNKRELSMLLSKAGFSAYDWSGSTISPYLSPSSGIFLRANEFDKRFFKFWKILNGLLERYLPARSYWDIIVVCGKAD